MNTNPFSSFRYSTRGPWGSHGRHAGSGRRARHLQRERGRGFTLIELMAVVIMIGILVALAVPATRLALKGKRAASAARQIEMIYQLARMRSVGRGSAVLVRFNPRAPVYGFSVREAVSGAGNTAGLCQLQPVSSCVRNPGRWTNPNLYREINKFQPLPGGDPAYENIDVEFKEYNGSSTTKVQQADICFAPSGRAYIRNSSNGAFRELTEVSGIEVSEKNSAGQLIGLKRTIYVLPNGIARLAL